MDGVSIAIGGRRYRVQCAPAEVDRLQALAKHVDARATEITRSQGHVQESMLLLLVCLTLADELEDTRGEGAKLRERASDAEQTAAAHGALVIEQTAERIAALARRIERQG